MKITSHLKLLLAISLLLSIFNVNNLVEAQYVSSYNIGGTDGYCRRDANGDFIESYILLSYASAKLAKPTSTDFQVDTFQMNWNIYEPASPYQVLYLKAYRPPSSSSIVANLNMTNLQDSTTLLIPLQNFYCTPFANQPLKIKNNITNYNAIFNPRSTRSLFNVEFDGVPIDNIGCRDINLKFDCSCAPNDLSYLSTTPSLLVRCSLAPRPTIFVDWNSTVVILYDLRRPNITEVRVNVNFPGMASSNTATTTLVTSIFAQPLNSTSIQSTYSSSYIDLYVNVAAKNSELIMYKASQDGAVPIGSTPYATYKPILGSNDNVLLHFTLPIDLGDTAGSTVTPAPFTSTVMFVLTSKSFLPTYHSYYPYQYVSALGTGVTTVNSSIVIASWTIASIQPYISFHPNINYKLAIPTIYQPFPFGLVSGSEQNGYNYRFAFNFFNTYNLTAWLPHREVSIRESITLNGGLNITPTPILQVSVRKLSSYQMILRIETIQDAVGYDGGYLPLTSDYGIKLPASDFIAPNVFEYEVNITRTNFGNYWRFIWMSFAGSRLTMIRQGDVLGGSSTSLTQVPALPGLLSYTVDDIIELYWSPSMVDVTNGPATTTIYYKLAPTITLGPNEQPAVLIYQIHKSNADDLSQYHVGSVENGYLKVEVEIKEKSYPGSVVYYLATANYNLFGELIATNPLIGAKNATLTVVCQYADEMGPIVRSLQPIQSSITTVTQSDIVNLSWKVTIEDQPTGLYLSKSYAIITSNLDPTHRKTKLTLISGDAFSGIYNVSYSYRSGPQYETFKLDLVLTDYLDNVASSLADVSGQDQVNVDPFLYLTTQSNQNRYITVSYPQIVADVTPPVLTKFQIQTPLPIDVSVSERTIQFVFTLYDADSGVSLTSKPTIYITAKNGETISGVGTNVFSSAPSTSVNPGNVTYQCNITLPYGFSYANSALISLFGFSDNNRNFGGYTPDTISAFGPNFITTSMTSNAPVILSYGGFKSKFSGPQSITIRGRRLSTLAADSNDTSVTLYDNQVPLLISPTFVSSSVVVFNAILAPLTSTYSISVRVAGIESNIVNLTTINIPPPVRPTQPPVPTSKPMACPTGPSSSLQCSGNGQCDITTGKCTCSGNFAGDDCSLTRTNGTDTNIDPNEPTTTTNTSSVITGVSVIEVQELDLDNQIYARYPLAGWQFTNSTVDDSLVYIYSSIFTNSSTGTNVGSSTIVVRVQYFLKDSTVAFGGQNISMLAGTVKYTITLSQYNFATLTNSLRVIMRIDAGFETDDACLSIDTSKNSEQQTSNNIEWLKLRVNDKMLYGRFVNVALIDGRLQSVGNILLSQNQSSQVSSAIVGINLPYYDYSSILDPDFSVLTTPDGDYNGCSSSDGGWSKGKLAAIIISCVAGAAVLGFIGFMVVKRKLKYRYRIMVESRKHKRALNRSGESKLSELNSSQSP